ncbi:hypothetical protein CAEBREN_14506 [Caenorhabditis brenneri]|uniref:B box-type domain-containing protein n=1 Tax=Caenorhabditis brenneri TaxID=135651 RepID=G0N206_CAEBE|nr:hypothetical protein CAEBREN_14506 [Caenorhabditis brenneri]
MLECGHTYCLLCLKQKEKESAHKNFYLVALTPEYGRCPVDESRIYRDVEFRPTNCLILDLVDRLVEDRRKKAAKNVTDPFVPCFEDNNHESDVWCQDCEQTYCNECSTTVHTLKVLRAHKRVPVSERQIREIPACPIHPEKNASYVCLRPTCSAAEKIYCTLCQKARTHQGHKSKKIEEHIESNRKRLDEQHNRLSVSVNVLKKKSNDSKKALETFMDKEEIASGWKKYEDRLNRERELAQSRYAEWAVKMKEELKEEHIKCVRDLQQHQELLKKVSEKMRRKRTLYDINDITKERIQGFEKKTYPTLQDYDFPDGMGPIGPVVVKRNEDRTIPLEPVPEQVDAPEEPVDIDVDDDDDIQVLN